MNAHKTLLKRWAPLLNYRAAGKLNVRYAIFALCHTLALASFASIAGAQAPAQITVAEALKVVNTYTIQQKSNGRYMDAHLNPATGFRVVTRPPQRNETQQWILTPVGPNTYTIQQNSHERYMDAHENAKNDFRLVTRPAQRNDTQKWILTLFTRKEALQPQDGIVVHIRNGKSKYHLTQDYNGNRDDRRNVSVWPLANNDGFRWLLYKTGDGYYYISNVASGLVLTQDGSGDNRNVSNWGRVPNWKRQHWRFVPGADNFYHLVNRETGQGLDQAYQGNRDDKRNVTTWPGQTFRDKGWSWRLEGGGSPKLVKLFIEKIKCIKTSDSPGDQNHARDVVDTVLKKAKEHAAQAGQNPAGQFVTWAMIREVANEAAFKKAIQVLAAEGGGKFLKTDQVWAYIEDAFNHKFGGGSTLDADDLNILVNGVSIWPNGGRSHRKITSQQTHDVNTEYLFNRAKGLKIQLMEYDSISSDDSMGSNFQAPNLLDQARRFERVFIEHIRSLYEITWRIEPLNYGPAAGSGSPQGAPAIAPQPPRQARVQPQITVAMVLGEYRYHPFQNNWHIGWIEKDGAGLRWRNKAGARWRLTPDFANKRLLTGTDNPYYTQGRREFKLIMRNGQITAFQFGGETYSKP